MSADNTISNNSKWNNTGLNLTLLRTSHEIQISSKLIMCPSIFLSHAFCRVWYVRISTFMWFVLLTVLPSCQLFSWFISLSVGILQILQACVCVHVCIDLYLWSPKMCVRHSYWWITSLLIAYITNHLRIITLLMQISSNVCVVGRERERKRGGWGGNTYVCKIMQALIYI